MFIMNSQVDKQELIDWISSLTDIAMLQNIQSLKNSSEGKDWWDELSEAEKESIKRGEEDIKAGRVYSSEEFWEKVDSMRKKYT